MMRTKYECLLCLKMDKDIAICKDDKGSGRQQRGRNECDELTWYDVAGNERDGQPGPYGIKERLNERDGQPGPYELKERLRC
jgi:hypothetical protein